LVKAAFYAAKARCFSDVICLLERLLFVKESLDLSEAFCSRCLFWLSRPGHREDVPTGFILNGFFQANFLGGADVTIANKLFAASVCSRSYEIGINSFLKRV